MMSDFVSGGIWEDLLRKHWTYLETEECIAKLETRKKLEDCIKEFLCFVQHDRKFILAETTRVLKNSMRELENFSAQKGMNAFESINQYANNIFTKPWRKEFRDLKLYSGFYQHEIKSNLVDAELLFETMGYRRLTKETLVLNGPICPDQVANVSRDAMIAYVELQIMKHIYAGLETIGIPCSWLDIYYYRENFTGSPSQAIKALAISFEEKRFRARQKMSMADNYDYIDAPPSSNNYAAGIQFCPAECQCRIYQQAHQISSRQRPVTCTNGICCAPEERQKHSLTELNSVYSNMPYPGQQQHTHYNHQQHHLGGLSNENGATLLSHMAHSRSLDHYSEHPNHYNNLLLTHRHSLDHQQQQSCTAHHQFHNTQQHKLHQLQLQQQQQQQQQHYYQHLNNVQQSIYESPYNCADGNSLGGDSSSISYAHGTGGGANCSLNPNPTYSHPYNVSGNRIPLPLNISNELFYENPESGNMCYEPTNADETMYPLKSSLPQNLAKNSSIYNNPNNNQSSQNSKTALIGRDFLQKQLSSQSEQMINFDDASHSTLQQSYETLNYLSDNHYNTQNNREKSITLSTSTSAISQQDCGPGKPSTNDEAYGYAKPIPRECRKQNVPTLRKYTYNNGATTDISYESPNDDIVHVSAREMEWNRQSSPTALSSKNQDGVGSAELWSNVYQNVEKKGQGQRADLLFQSLNLDSLNINSDTAASQSSSTDKRRSFYCSSNENKTVQLHDQQQQQQKQQQQLEPKLKSKTYENAKYLTKSNSNADKVSSSSFSANNIQKQKPSSDNNTKKVKSAPKQTKSNTTSTNKSQTKLNDNKSLPKTALNAINNNNNNDLIDLSGRGSTQNRKPSSSSSSGNATNRAPTVSSMKIIVTSDNEWSCQHCTFINPNSKRVCEMCYKSKDFKLDTSSSTAAGTTTTTATTTVTQNTPTCA